MRVVYVTSDVTYVRDNYLHLLTQVTDPARLPPGVTVREVVLLRIPAWLVLRNAIGLPVLGAPRVGLALLRNFVQARCGDPRVRMLEERGLPVFRCGSMNEPATLAHLREGGAPDLIVNLRTRNIYKAEILGLPKIGCLNIHHGLLPDHRGTMCDLWAWSEGRPVGFTIHWMNEKIDDGRLVARREIDAKRFTSYVDIPMESSRVEAETLLDVLRQVQANGSLTGEPNRSTGTPHTRNPTFAQIQAMRRKGLRL